MADVAGVHPPEKKNVVCRAIDSALRVVLRQIPVSSTTERIALWWGYRFRPAPATVRLRSGALIQTTHTDYLQLLLYYLGTFEPDSLAAMRRYAKPGDTVLDIGANIGLFTIEGSLAVGPTGRVIAIEAMPAHANSVVKSAGLNQMKNIEVVSVAAGSETGEASLTLPSGTNLGMFTLGKVSGDLSFRVPVQRVDDILAGRGITHVDFIKMDIEGSELKALLGAESTLRTYRPTILIELHVHHLNDCGTSSRELKEFLFNLGYQGSLLNGIPISADQIHDGDECVFVHRNSKHTEAIAVDSRS